MLSQEPEDITQRNQGRVAAVDKVVAALSECQTKGSKTYALEMPKVQTVSESLYHLVTKAASGPFAAEENTCLNEDIVPVSEDYPYVYALIGTTKVTDFAVCAKLEEVDGWEKVGNEQFIYTTADFDESWPESIACESGVSECYYCVKSE